jgi:TolB-like protein/DNA-binding winged helix-turn-helix (wHTH) protein
MSAPADIEVFAFAGFSLDARQRLLFAPDGSPVPLVGRAFDTLLFLVEHRDQLIDKKTLMSAIWPDVVVEENNLNQNISIVRKALGEIPGENRFIVTVPGRGFRFVPKVERLTPTSTGTALLATPIPPPDIAVRPVARPRLAWLVALLVAMLGLAAAAWLLYGQKAGVATDDSAIAVLPFVNISGDKEQEYFADGLTEELSAQLAGLNGLRVVGRASAFQFKGKNEDLRTVARILGVGHLVEGSVRRSANDIRITAELVDAASGERLWTKVYERKLEDIFAIQDEISTAIANELRVTLRRQVAEADLPRTHNVAAYDAYLAAEARLKNFGSSEYLRGIADLERAVTLDPQFAQAWSSLADAYESAAYGLAVDTPGYQEKAQQAMSRALALMPDSPRLQAQVAMRSMTSHADWRALEAILTREFDVAGRGDYWSNYNFGQLLLDLGRPREAIEYITRARRAEPLLLAPSVLLQEAQLHLENWDAARAEYEHSKTLVGDSLFADGEGLLAPGLDRHERSLVEKFLRAHPAPSTTPLLEGLERPPVAIEYLRSRMQGTAEPGLSALELAAFAAFYGDSDLALQGLRSGLRDLPFNAFFVWRSVYKDARQRPAFKTLLRELHLVDYWRATNNWGEFCRPIGAEDFECR